MHFDKRLFY